MIKAHFLFSFFSSKELSASTVFPSVLLFAHSELQTCTAILHIIFHLFLIAHVDYVFLTRP
jgi:hypothetical protein